jgi:hypothetical protein
MLFNANTIFAADGLAFTHTYKVLQEVNKRHLKQLPDWKKRKKRRKKRNLPLVSDLDVVGGLSTNVRPL